MSRGYVAGKGDVKMTGMPIENDVAYLLRRAEQEAITAIVSDNTPGAPAHYEMSRRYSAMAIRALANPKAVSRPLTDSSALR